MDHTQTETPISTNPALPGLIILLLCAFIIWAIPHVLRFALILIEELFLLLEEVASGVAKGATIVWNSWAKVRVDAILPQTQL